VSVGQTSASKFTDHNSEAVDHFGTFALLYNWFPVEGREIRHTPNAEIRVLRHPPSF
jgi:hypothetical protein